MGDMTKEPSMEEILSSIKRIIAEEGEEAVQAVVEVALKALGCEVERVVYTPSGLALRSARRLVEAGGPIARRGRHRRLVHRDVDRRTL